MTRKARLKCTAHNGKSIFLHTPHLAHDLERIWQKNMHPVPPVHIVAPQQRAIPDETTRCVESSSSTTPRRQTVTTHFR
jgi:hypothetical protein